MNNMSVLLTDDNNHIKNVNTKENWKSRDYLKIMINNKVETYLQSKFKNFHKHYVAREHRQNWN